MSDEENVIRGRYSEEINRLRDEIGQLRLNAQCHPAACRDEMLWRAEIERLRAALTFYAEASWSELDDDLQDHYENGVFMGCSPGLKAKRALAGEQEKVG